MWLLSGLTLFMGCPTPPDKAASNNTAQGPQNPPPGQNGENGPNGTQGNPPPQDGPSGVPPGEGKNAMGDAPMGENPPPNEGGSPDGKGKPADPNNEAIDGQAPTDGEAIPTPDGEEGGVDAVQIQGEPPPQNAEPTPVKESLLIRVERIPSKGAKAKFTQEQLKDDGVTLSGTATCDDCEGPLVLRAVRFLGPNDNHSENNLITQKNVEAGEYSILVPEDETAIALELLVDKNEDGQPSAGEYFAVIEMAGQLIPDKDRSGLNLNSTKRTFFTPAPAPGTQGPQ